MYLILRINFRNTIVTSLIEVDLVLHHLQQNLFQSVTQFKYILYLWKKSLCKSSLILIKWLIVPVYIHFGIDQNSAQFFCFVCLFLYILVSVRPRFHKFSLSLVVISIFFIYVFPFPLWKICTVIRSNSCKTSKVILARDILPHLYYWLAWIVLKYIPCFFLFFFFFNLSIKITLEKFIILFLVQNACWSDNFS